MAERPEDKALRGMLLRGEGTEDLSSNNDDHHDDNCDDGGGGNLSEYKPGKTVVSERRCGQQVHVQTVINIFVVPGLVPKRIEQGEGGGG